MKITEIRLKKVENESRVKAYATITFDNEFAVHNIKIMLSKENELYICMPSKRNPNGEFKDIAHPINTETRAKIEKDLIKAYKGEK